MKRLHPLTLGTALWAVILGFTFTLTGKGEGPLPASDIAKLIAHDAKYIDADLSKTTFTKKGQKRVRMAGFLIALYAQNAKDNAPAMATLRDQGLKLMEAAQAGKADDAKKLAATLKADIKADPAAKTTAIALEKHLDLETLMAMFNSEKTGGFGMEKDLEDLVTAKGLDAAQLEKTALLGIKVGLIGQVTQAHAPKKTGDKKSWDALAMEMQTEAGTLATATKSGDIGKIANKLMATCTKCHDMFR